MHGHGILPRARTLAVEPEPVGGHDGVVHRGEVDERLRTIGRERIVGDENVLVDRRRGNTAAGNLILQVRKIGGLRHDIDGEKARRIGVTRGIEPISAEGQFLRARSLAPVLAGERVDLFQGLADEMVAGDETVRRLQQQRAGAIVREHIVPEEVARAARG
jgi:hypothetical protein